MKTKPAPARSLRRRPDRKPHGSSSFSSPKRAGRGKTAGPGHGSARVRKKAETRQPPRARKPSPSRPSRPRRSEAAPPIAIVQELASYWRSAYAPQRREVRRHLAACADVLHGVEDPEPGYLLIDLYEAFRLLTFSHLRILAIFLAWGVRYNVRSLRRFALDLQIQLEAFDDEAGDARSET